MPNYDTFILRVWRNLGLEGLQWSARLEHVQQANTTQFSSLEVLLDHLRIVAGPLHVGSDDQDDSRQYRPEDGTESNARGNP